jgi:hypothetical protein
MAWRVLRTALRVTAPGRRGNLEPASRRKKQMLTVKHIDESSFENVFLATQVSTRGREYPAQIVKDQPILDYPNFIVDCVRNQTDVVTFRDGQIYVMNENGKTVASYDLRPFRGVKADTASIAAFLSEKQ